MAPEKKANVFIIGSAMSSPHIQAGIDASEFERHGIMYSSETTDEELEAIKDELAQADMLCLGGDSFVDARLLSYVPNVKVISVNGVGYDGVDVAAVTKAGIFLANAPVLRDACADMAMLLMLAVMRKAPVGQAVAAGSQPSGWDWDAMRMIIGEDPGGKTLGLVGFGRIGQTFAAKAQAAFKMKIVYYDPVQSPPNRTTGGTDAGGEASTPYFELNPPPQWVTLDELLASADVVSMHCSLSASTRRLMSASQFAKMKKGSYFVNMARGGLVDEEALADALLSGHLAGAGIDVFEKEPFVHPKLLTCSNAFLLPHLASATESTRYDMTQRMLENARRVLWDKSAPLNPLNAPTAPMSALSADEQTRVHDYIAAEFAYEEAEVLVEESARL